MRFLQQLEPPRRRGAEHLLDSARLLRLETERLKQRGARLRVIGRRDRLPKLLVREIETPNRLGERRALQLRVAIIILPAMQLRAPRSELRTLRRSTAFNGSGRSTPQAGSSAEGGEVDLLVRPAARSGSPTFCCGSLHMPNFCLLTKCGRTLMQLIGCSGQRVQMRERRFGGVPAPPALSTFSHAGPSLNPRLDP